VFYGFNYGESNAKTYITLSLRLDEKKKNGKIYKKKNVISLVNVILKASFKGFKYDKLNTKDYTTLFLE
jgi:hypothetical protein